MCGCATPQGLVLVAVLVPQLELKPSEVSNLIHTCGSALITAMEPVSQRT